MGSISLFLKKERKKEKIIWPTISRSPPNSRGYRDPKNQIRSPQVWPRFFGIVRKLIMSALIFKMLEAEKSVRCHGNQAN